MTGELYQLPHLPVGPGVVGAKNNVEALKKDVRQWYRQFYIIAIPSAASRIGR